MELLQSKASYLYEHLGCPSNTSVYEIAVSVDETWCYFKVLGCLYLVLEKSDNKFIIYKIH